MHRFNRLGDIVIVNKKDCCNCKYLNTTECLVPENGGCNKYINRGGENRFFNKYYWIFLNLFKGKFVPLNEWGVKQAFILFKTYEEKGWKGIEEFDISFNPEFYKKLIYVLKEVLENEYY